MFHNSIHIPRGCVPSSLHHIIAANNYQCGSQPAIQDRDYVNKHQRTHRSKTTLLVREWGEVRRGARILLFTYKTKRKLSAQK